MHFVKDRSEMKEATRGEMEIPLEEGDVLEGEFEKDSETGQLRVLVDLDELPRHKVIHVLLKDGSGERFKGTVDEDANWTPATH